MPPDPRRPTPPAPGPADRDLPAHNPPDPDTADRDLPARDLPTPGTADRDLPARDLPDPGLAAPDLDTPTTADHDLPTRDRRSPAGALGRPGAGVGPRRRIAGALRRLAPPALAVAIVVVAWQLVAAHDPYLLPRPLATLGQLGAHPHLFLDTTRTTLVEAAAGLGIGGVAAVLVAVAMAEVRAVERAVTPLAVVLNVTPVVAVAPALAVALGFGAGPKVVITALIVFYTVLVTTLAGLRSADPRVLDVLRTLHASRLETLRRVRIPSALPSVLTGLRIALPLAVVGAVVAEFVAPNSSPGLGTLIATASAYDHLAQVYAALLCLAVIGVALTSALGALERRLLRGRTAGPGS